MTCYATNNNRAAAPVCLVDATIHGLIRVRNSLHSFIRSIGGDEAGDGRDIGPCIVFFVVFEDRSERPIRASHPAGERGNLLRAVWEKDGVVIVRVGCVDFGQVPNSLAREIDLDDLPHLVDIFGIVVHLAFGFAGSIRQGLQFADVAEQPLCLVASNSSDEVAEPRTNRIAFINTELYVHVFIPSLSVSNSSFIFRPVKPLFGSPHVVMQQEGRLPQVRVHIFGTHCKRLVWIPGIVLAHDFVKRQPREIDDNLVGDVSDRSTG
mmetsp:Transcript_21819/g.51935  ORF Transcript_21819/g.51935 Transcript_21819/m.51935 type:complete len:265 (-) Transcript_21819:325-1119(-)